MPVREPMPEAVEPGLRSIEDLLAQDATSVAELALDLMEPGIVALMDEGQAVRLQAVRAALGLEPELPRVDEGFSDDEPPDDVVVPFRRR